MHNISALFTSLFQEFSISQRNYLYIVLAVVAGIGCRYILFSILRPLLAQLKDRVVASLMGKLKGVSFILLPAFFILLFIPLMQADVGFIKFLQRTLQITFIISFAWVIIIAINFLEDVLWTQLDVTVADNYAARKRRTQILMVKRILIIAVVLVTIALVLMRFEGMRKLGISILTSAGIMGIIIGFAAQKSIANLLAGLQVAFTQPIRIDDVVVVEGEWGNIEEINMLYVVVRIWDLRRLILPITYFLEKPFQNWTRNSAAILGTVFIYTDYAVPIEEMRAELKRIVSASKLWDTKVCQIVVTNLTSNDMELRALVSASNSGAAWDLRCLVREKLIGFIRENYPESLPRNRFEIKSTQNARVPENEEDNVSQNAYFNK